MTCPGCSRAVSTCRRGVHSRIIDSTGRRWHRACAVVFLGAHDLRLSDLRAHCDTIDKLEHRLTQTEGLER